MTEIKIRNLSHERGISVMCSLIDGTETPLEYVPPGELTTILCGDTGTGYLKIYVSQKESWKGLIPFSGFDIINVDPEKGTVSYRGELLPNLIENDSLGSTSQTKTSTRVLWAFLLVGLVVLILYIVINYLLNKKKR